MGIGLWLFLAALAVVLVGLGLFWPRPSARPLFRVCVWATDPDCDGIRAWRYEVRDTSRAEGGQCVVSGACVSWQNAMTEALTLRDRCEQGWIWEHRESWAA